MSNTISISNFSLPFIDDLEDFINRSSVSDIYNLFPLFNSQKEASSAGFIAHHITPVSIQMKKVKEEQGIDFREKYSTPSKARSMFQKEGYVYDDRCLGLPDNLWHLIVHFVEARDIKGDYIEVFNNMKSFYIERLPDNNKITLQHLKNWAETLEEGERKRSHKMKEYYSDPVNYENAIKINKEIGSRPEVREKQSLSRKRYFQNIMESPENYQKYCLNIGKMWDNPEYREHRNKGLRRYWDNISKEEYEKVCQNHKEVSNRPDIKIKQSNSQKERFRKLKENKEEYDKYYQENYERLHGPDMILKREMCKMEYQKAKQIDATINWNSFQKEFFDKIKKGL